jgi:hypothetical protein
MTLNELLQIAGILIGFQLTFFTFRLTRELTFKPKDRWFPIPDFINLLSVLITVLFIFIYPLKNIETFDIDVCQKMFGFSVLLFVLYPFALIGHYKLFTKSPKTPTDKTLTDETTSDATPADEEPEYIPNQEKWVLIIGGFASILYFLL